jgi:hypothetical protein
MSLKKHLRYALNLFRLNEPAIKNLAEEKTSTIWGIIMILIAGLSLGTGLYLTNNSLPPGIIIGGAILVFLLTFIGISFLFFFSHLLGGKGNFTQYFRAYSHMYLLNILAIIPVVGLFFSSLIGIWQIIMAIWVTKVVRQMPTAKAALIVLVPIIILFMVITYTALFFDLKIFLQYFFTFIRPTQ